MVEQVSGWEATSSKRYCKIEILTFKLDIPDENLIKALNLLKTQLDNP